MTEQKRHPGIWGKYYGNGNWQGSTPQRDIERNPRTSQELVKKLKRIYLRPNATEQKLRQVLNSRTKFY